MPDSILPTAPPAGDTARPRRLVVAIDGPAGAGKSSVSRQLAGALGALYIDTGAMYRAVACTALQKGVDTEDPAALSELAGSIKIVLLPPAPDGPDTVRVLVDGEEITDRIRTPEISSLTSTISAISGVRRHMVAQQRALGAGGGVVMEGRDIGTVVFPDADVKIFLTASPEVRALRRQAQLAAAGKPVPLDALVREILERDDRDSGRADSPLAPAPDAVQVVTDGLTEVSVVQRLLAICRAAAVHNAGRA